MEVAVDILADKSALPIIAGNGGGQDVFDVDGDDHFGVGVVLVGGQVAFDDLAGSVVDGGRAAISDLEVATLLGLAIDFEHACDAIAESELVAGA